MIPRQAEPTAKIELTLAPFGLPSLVAAYERLTGKKMSAEGIAKLKATLEQDGAPTE
jgi:hypothetical protein